MSAVTFMDASTVGVLVGARNRAGRGSRQSGKRRPEVAAVRSRSGGGRVPFRVGFAASAPSQGHRRIEPIPVVARLDDGFRPPERLAEYRVAGLPGTPPNGEAGRVELLEWRISESLHRLLKGFSEPVEVGSPG